MKALSSFLNDAVYEASKEIVQTVCTELCKYRYFYYDEERSELSDEYALWQQCEQCPLRELFR